MVYISYYIFGQLSDIAVDQYQSVTDDKGNGPMYKKKNLENISLDNKIIPDGHHACLCSTQNCHP